MSQGVAVYVTYASDVLLICWFGTQLTQHVRNNVLLLLLLLLLMLLLLLLVVVVVMVVVVVVAAAAAVAAVLVLVLLLVLFDGVGIVVGVVSCLCRS